MVAPKALDSLTPPRPSKLPVAHFGELDAASFRERYVRPGRPVLIQGAMGHWKALERWQRPGYLESISGDQPILVSPQGTGSKRIVPLAGFWADVFAEDGTSGHYLNAIVHRKGKPGVLGCLADDVEDGPYLCRGDVLACKVFGGRDCRCGLHYHSDSEAFLCQVVGEKHVILFPPSDSRQLLPIAWHAKHENFSRIPFPRDGSWPDLNAYPSLAQSHPVEVTVQTGDVLFIPIHWWHVVLGPGTSICVTHFFRSSLRKRFFTRMGIRSNYLSGRSLREKCVFWRSTRS